MQDILGWLVGLLGLDKVVLPLVVAVLNRWFDLILLIVISP